MLLRVGFGRPLSEYLLPARHTDCYVTAEVGRVIAYLRRFFSLCMLQGSAIERKRLTSVKSAVGRGAHAAPVTSILDPLTDGLPG